MTRSLTPVARSHPTPPSPPSSLPQAEEFAAADKKKKEFIEAKNDADSLVYSTDKSLSEHKSKLGADDISEIEKALAETRAALGSEAQDADALKAATQKLQTAAMKIGTAMYKNAGASSGGAAGGEEAKKPEGETVDAEFKEKK
jgi:molecular chaperone DnaK